MNLKLTGLLLAGATLCMTASAATTVQTFFFDFGPIRFRAKQRGQPW